MSGEKGVLPNESGGEADCAVPRANEVLNEPVGNKNGSTEMADVC